MMAEELLFSEQIAASVKKAKIVLICGETASSKLVDCFMEELTRNGFQNVTPVQCGNYQFNVDLNFDLAIALNCTLPPLSKCMQFNGKLITAEVSGSLFRLFVDLGRNHRFDVLLSGDKPRGTEFTKIHPGNLTVVVCDRPHGLRTGQTCELSVNLPQFRDGYSSAVEVLTEKTFAVDIDTSSLLTGGRDDPRTGERVVQVSGFVRPASSALATSFENLASQLRKHPKFDPCNEFETKELKKSHALLNTYLGYCSYSRKKGSQGAADDFAKLVSSGQADFGSLFDICFLQAEDIESVAKGFRLFTAMSELPALVRLAASLTVVEAVKAVSHKLEPLQQWLIVDWSDLATLENVQLGQDTRVLVVSGVSSLGKSIVSLIKEQSGLTATLVEDEDPKHPLHQDDGAFFDQFDVVLAAGCREGTLDSLRRRLVTKSRPLIAVRMGGPGELIAAVDVTVPGQTDLPQIGDMKPLLGGSFAPPPHCVVKNFPNQVSHCILWAIDKFESLFRTKPEISNKFIEEVEKNGGGGGGYDQASASALVHYFYNNTKSFVDCLYMARVKFEKYFDFKARQLVFNFPPDHKQADGKKFWALPRQMPRPLDFDELIEASGPARQFLLAAAELFAVIYKVEIPSNVQEIVGDFLASERCKTLPNFIAKQKRIDTSEKEDESSSRTRSPIAAPAKLNGDAEVVNGNGVSPVEDGEAAVEKALQLVRNLSSPKQLGLVEPLRPDRRTTAAFRFVEAAANLRASMYGVGIGSISNGQLAKFIAANRTCTQLIDPVWTLPAVEYFAAELGIVELLKLLLSLRLQSPDNAEAAVESYRNTEMDFSKSLVIKRTKPKAASVNVLNENCSFTVWDKWRFEASRNETTVADFLDKVSQSRGGIKVSAVVQGARPVYFPLLPGQQERLAKPLFDFVDATHQVEPDTVQLTLLIEPPPGAPMDAEDIESPPVLVRFF